MSEDVGSDEKLPLRERGWFIAASLFIIAALFYFFLYVPHQQKLRCEELLSIMAEPFAVEGVSSSAMERYILEREVEYLEDCL